MVDVPKFVPLSKLYVPPVKAVTDIVPVATVQVGWVGVAVGAAGLGLTINFTSVFVADLQFVVVLNVSTKQLPAAVGVKVKVLLAFNVPAASYQFADSPAPTVTVNTGIVVPAQMVLSPPLTGGFIFGQAQFGAVTGTSIVQEPNVAVKVTFVPEAIPETVLAVLSTVPAVLVTVPELVKVTV